ncbi:MAG: TonB-dependent receptor [Bryobacter sp.]|jgi:outer membrane cobalamin receptor|nr:TonB-dependent receptor [Bryobacter sp.]
MAFTFAVPATASSPADEAEPVRTSITITEKVSAEAPGAVTRLGKERIAELPGVHLDDRLRLVPGFSLFRRTSSLVANPTTQGMSLRGIGSTGASRSLLLWDGVPLNSPFGGWIYWNRVSPGEVQEVEISRGATTAVFGDKAMGGALALFSPLDRSAWSAGFDAGNLSQIGVHGAYTAPLGSRWAVTARTRFFDFDGYYLVPSPPRGAVDTRANSRFASGQARADYAGAKDRLFLRLDVLAEERENGTELQRNSTGTGTLAAQYQREMGAAGGLALTAFHTREEYRASFSSIAANRQSERLTSLQSVPSEATGFSAMLRRGGARGSWIAGGDYQRVEGYSIETLFPAGNRTGGGVQNQGGFFGQGDVTLGRARLFGGLRGHETGNGSFWSPAGGVTVGFEHWRFRGSAYRAFRAPTLNELFREFRAGNAVTLANAALEAESLQAVEAGMDGVWSTRSLRFTAFRNSLDGLITNVTLSSTPALITRQRQNAGAALNRGVEAGYRERWRGFAFDAAWLLADSRFAAGERVPQVAKNQGSAMLSWSRATTTLTGGLRAASLQFEDDRNQFILPGFVVWHLTGRHRLSSRVWIDFALENTFNRDVLAGFSPTPLLASPRMARVGLTFRSM